MNGIHYCTWAKAKDSFELTILMESAGRLGINIEVMQCNGFLQKPLALRQHLATLPENDLALCTDGYDVIYIRGEDAIRSGFEEFDSPLVFSGEKHCYHHLPDSKIYFEQSGGTGLYRYLNSGLMIGYVGAFIPMLDEVIRLKEGLRREFGSTPNTVGFFNDQTIYGRYALLNPEEIAIDLNAALFWTMSEEKYDIAEYVEIDARRLRNRESFTEPCIIHVSHLSKFYLAYLYVVWKLDIPLATHNLNFAILNRVLNAPVHASKESIVVDPELRQVLIAILDHQNPPGLHKMPE